jgi:hypothetical protein
MLLLAVHPQSWMPYVQMGFRTITEVYYAQKAEISSQVASTFFFIFEVELPPFLF